MPRRLSTCKRSDCTEPPFMGGLCKSHHEDAQAKAQAREDAKHLLDFGIVDGNSPAHPDLVKELKTLRRWWDRICSATNAEREDPALKGETKFASEWCLSLAKSIIRDERSHRSGQATTHPDPNREDTWERFRLLESRNQSSEAR